MNSDHKCGFSPSGKAKITLLGALMVMLSLPVLPVFAPSSSLAEAEADFSVPVIAAAAIPETLLIQENSFLPTSRHYLPKAELIVLEKIDVVVTAYSSSVWETDDTPYLTAANTLTRDGVVASNLLPFGTKIRIPGLFGEKIFAVEDRMNQRIGDFQIDIWFPTAWEAKQFGVKYTYIETLQ